MPANEIIGIEPVRERAITAEKLAINAVMAGCLPMHFPAVISAWMAMLKEEFLLHGTTASTGGFRPLADIHVILFLAILSDGKAAFRLGFGAISGWNRITDTRIFSRQRDRVYK